VLKLQLRQSVDQDGLKQISSHARTDSPSALNATKSAGSHLTQRVAQIVVLTIGCFVLARFGHTLTSLSPGVVLAWPENGFAVAGLVLFGRQAWPGVAIGELLAMLSIEPLASEAVGWALAALAAPVLAAWLLERYSLDSALSRLRDVLAVVILGGAVSSLLSATIGLAVLMGAGDLTRGYAGVFWFSWWQTDTLGVVLVTPLLLVLGTAAGLRSNPFQHRGMEMAALTLVAAIVTYLLFGFTFPIIFLVFPFTLWMALRLGVPGVAVLNILLGGIALWASIEKRGPFAQLSPVESQIVLQSFCASVTITSLVLAAITAERKQAINDARASRARIVKTADSERRRVERNLHDGAQQRLVSLSVLLSLAQTRLASQPDRELKTVLSQASDELQAALTELRELARGLHPVILTHQGLNAAVHSLAEQATLPVTVAIPDERFSAAVETTAYFVVCEALVNVTKHAHASAATVSINHADRRLSVQVTDDGIGGANLEAGSGLVGLADRVAALGGQLHINSPLGGGTRVCAELPCE